MQAGNRPRRRVWVLPSLVLSLTLLLTACGGAPSAPAPADSSGQKPAGSAPEKIEQKDIKLSSSVRGPGFLPMYVADAKGLWKAEGLNVEVVYFRSGEQNAQAVQGGAVDISGSAWAEPLNFYVAKQPFKAFFAVNNYPVYTWYTAPNVKSLDDLKGKKEIRAAVSGIGSLTYIIMQWGLRKAGFPDENVKYVPSGSASERSAALQAGQVDLITADPPTTYILEERGFNPVMQMTQFTKEFGYEAFYAKQDFIENKPGTIKAFLRGYIKGIRYMKAYPEEAAKILADVMGTKPEDQKHVLRAVNTMIDSFPEDGFVPEDGVQFLIDYYEEIGKVGKGLTYRDLQDDRYIKYFKENPVK